MSRELGTLRRGVSLSFRITNIREQFEQVQVLTRAITHAMTMLQILRLAYKAWLGTLGPVGWAMLGISAVGEAYMLQQEFTPKEEYRSRSPR